MPIDPLSEDLITLSQASKFLPNRPCIQTVYRWSKIGIRGFVLETIQCGNTRCTSRQAVARFIKALSVDTQVTPEPAPRSKSKRETASKKAGDALQKMGV